MTIPAGPRLDGKAAPADPSSGGLPRRRFLGRMFAGAAVGLLAPSSLPAFAGGGPSRSGRPGGRFGLPIGPADEDFWRQVKARFPLAPDRIVMNAANLCPAPIGVTEALSILAREIDSDVSFQNRARFGPMRDEARTAVAGFLGAEPDELALVRNTSEGNNVVIGGLELGPGDEVVLWDQNHPSNSAAWDVRAARSGFRVRRVRTPPVPAAPGELLQPFVEALGPAVRALAITHVSNVSGVRLPVREICRAARERGVATLVDGAQTFGAEVLDLHDLGCDFFTGSSHKWFMGPKEVGILYVRRGMAERVWPGVVSVGWPGAGDRGALRFETLGQRDDARVAVMESAVAFHRGVGPARVEARVRELVTALREGIREEVPGTRFVTPEDPALSGGVLIFELPGVDASAAYEALYRDHGIGAASMGGGIRLCPHIYNTMDDTGRVVAAVGVVARALRG